MKSNELQLTVKAARAGFFLLITALFVSCTKHDNDVQVINNTHSAIYDVYSADWTGDINGYNHYIEVPEITEDIYYNGAVLVYRLIEVVPKSFNMLPYTYTDNLLTINMDYDAYLGSINLLYKEVYDGVNDTRVPGNMSFKVVIIEGIPLAVLKRMVDVSNYSAVMKMLDNNDLSGQTIKF